MEPLKLTYRDVDRTPFLFTLKYAAEQRGVQLDISRAPGREYVELLLRGEVDFLAENYYNLQSFRARGAPVVSLATAVTWLNETLFVAPEVETLNDLRGRRFALRGLGPSEMIPRLWLQDAGLDRDVEPIVVSEDEVGRWGNWRKVLSGECAGCFVTNLYADAPREAGLKALPTDPYGFIGNVTLTTTRKVIGARQDEIEAIVRAAFDACELFKRDPKATLEVMSREPTQLLRIERDQTLERTYEILRDELSDVPLPSVDGIRNTCRMTLSRSADLADFNPLLMWDLSFASRIMQQAGALS